MLSHVTLLGKGRYIFHPTSWGKKVNITLTIDLTLFEIVDLRENMNAD